MVARKRTMRSALGTLTDADFWHTTASDVDRRSVTDAVAGREGVAPTARQVARGGDVASAPSGEQRSVEAAPHSRVLVEQGGVAGLEPLRLRRARRLRPTGRVVVRVPSAAMRWFAAVARAKGIGKAQLFERVLDGFLRRLETRGPELLVELQTDLGLQATLEIEDDLWSAAAPVPRLVADAGRQPTAMRQMSHAVDRELERRFDDCCWRWDLSKDALGRMIVLAFLIRSARRHTDPVAELGFHPAEVAEQAGATL